MAFTAKTKARLTSALTRKSLANEFEAKAASPGPISAKLKAAILSMMANKAAANQIIAALETVGNQTLTTNKPKTVIRLRNALTRKAAADEIDAQI